MNVGGISFRQTNFTANTQEPSKTFLYAPAPGKKRIEKSNYLFYSGIAAALAVAGMIWFLKGKKMPPVSIIDIADHNIGLNKLDGSKYGNMIKELREQILYPIKSVELGSKHIKEFKQGVVINGSTPDELRSVVDAFIEHAQKNEISCVRSPKNLRQAIIDAEERYKKNNRFTMVDLGDIANLGDLCKGKETEKLLGLDSNVHKGVIWVAWTTNPKSVPVYWHYKNYPVLITKASNN
jgi:hypothetical protein